MGSEMCIRDSITLVPDNGGRSTKLLSFFQTGPLKHPVFRAMHLVSSASVKNLAELMEASPQKTNSRELVFRPLDEMVTPQRREQGVPFRGVEWVLLESFLPADKVIAVVFRADLQTKLEMVDEALTEYLRIVHETVGLHFASFLLLKFCRVC